jgi:hypothetical protein
MNSITGTALNFTGNVAPLKDAGQRKAALRQAAQEVVSTTFLGEMLKMSRSSPFKNKMFHGGRGEEIFQAQLDGELTRRAGGSMQNNLSEAIVKRLAGHSAKADKNAVKAEKNMHQPKTDHFVPTTDH